ncbi:MAG: hypothetical protein ACKVOU_03685 [Cytophagales bacterium]
MSLFSPNLPSYKSNAIIGGLPQSIDDWKASDWQTYYKRIKTTYGKETALKVFTSDIDRIGFFSSGNNLKYDCDFIDFFKKEGLNGGNWISKVFCTANTVVDATTSTVSNVANTVKNVSNPTVLIIAGIAIGGFFLFNKYGKRK